MKKLFEDDTQANPQPEDTGSDNDNEVDNATQIENATQAVQDTQSNVAEPVAPEQNGTPLQTADGTAIAVDTSGQYDAISPNGVANISFDTGNWDTMLKREQKIGAKISTIQKTVVPLIEVGLIELLGNSSAYHGTSFNAAIGSDDACTVSAELSYKVPLFIGTDVEHEAVVKDSTYLYNRIKVAPNVTWKKCEINTTDGMVNLAFTM